jgi:uncharacterized membrane protein
VKFKPFRDSLYLVLLLLSLPLSINALTYLNFNSVYGFLTHKQEAIKSGFYLPAYYSHVLPASIILLIGIFQLHPYSRIKWYKAHKFLGKIYISCILFVSAPGALIMSFYIQRGISVQISFLFQCALWFVFTWIAYKAIKKGDIHSHIRWMIRSYSLTLAAITLRLYVFVGSYFFDLANSISYSVIAWLSWLPNLLICELLITQYKSTSQSYISN